MKALLFFVIFTSMIAMQSLTAQKTLRVMTYNIHNGVGMDGKSDYQRISDVILKEYPDIVAVQEIDSVTHRANGVDILREIAGNTLMHKIYAPAISFQGGKYGIGLLSKEKALNFRYLPLPGKESRVLLIAEFKDYVIYGTHFALNEADQLSSVAIIKKEIAKESKPVVLAGDLNALPDSPVMNELVKEQFVSLANVKNKTYPADKVTECLDYILGYTGNGHTYTSLSNKVINETVASDHRPVLSVLALKTDKDKIFRTRPYLQNPVDNGMTVSWLTNTKVYSWVEYGTDTTNLKRAHTIVDGQVISNNYIHKIRLEDLKAGDTYYYRICSKEILSYQAYSKAFGETAISDFYNFKLADEETTDFTALIFNDVHQRYKTVEVLYEHLKDIKYDFVMFNGDCIDDPANEAQAVVSISALNDIVGAEYVPVFYLRGNHEIRNAYSIGLRDLFDYVGDKTYGSFNWGDTRFVMLDCGEDKADDHWVYYGLNDFTKLRHDQVDFLETELKSKAYRKAEKRVLVHHIPVYGTTDKYQPCNELWGDLLKKAPFNVALNGHTHKYVYHPKASIGNNYPVFVGGGYKMEDATAMILTKKGKEMTLKVINTKGETLKEMAL